MIASFKVNPNDLLMFTVYRKKAPEEQKRKPHIGNSAAEAGLRITHPYIPQKKLI